MEVLMKGKGQYGSPPSLVLTSLDQLIMQKLCTFFTKSLFNEEVNRTRLSPISKAYLHVSPILHYAY
jgi:hypothetical protein